MNKRFAEFVQRQDDDIFYALDQGLRYVARALDAGASPNAYHEKGLHFLVYAYQVGLLDDDLLAFMVKKGSDLDLPGVKFKRNLDGTKAILERPELRQTVGEWVGAPDNIFTSDARLTFIAIFDAASYLAGEDYADADLFSIAVTAHSNCVVRKMISLGFQTAPEDLTMAADAYNRVAHAEIIATGIEPTDEHASYLLNKADRSRIWNTMIVDMARYGYTYTERQRDRIEAISVTALKEIERLEQSPYWTRTCRVENNIVSVELERDAVAHGIDPSEPKKTICNGIKHANIKETSLVCTNRHMMKRDYSDLEMVKYAVDGKTWCFTYENFEELQRDGINPFTGLELPDRILAEMSAKNRLFSGKD